MAASILPTPPLVHMHDAPAREAPIVRDLAFRETDIIGDLTIGDAGEEVIIVASAPYGWKVHRHSIREGERFLAAYAQALQNARLTRHANLGLPDIRPAREACSP